MNKSQHIGRIALLKYYLIFILIAVLTPVITELILSNSIDFIAAFKELFKINSIEKNEVRIALLLLLIQLSAVWFLGGKAGELIIDKRREKFIISFINVLLLWFIYFINTSLLNLIILNKTTPVHLVLNSIVTIFYFSLIMGSINGFVMAYFMGKEIERKGNI